MRFKERLIEFSLNRSVLLYVVQVRLLSSSWHLYGDIMFVYEMYMFLLFVKLRLSLSTLLQDVITSIKQSMLGITNL